MNNPTDSMDSTKAVTDLINVMTGGPGAGYFEGPAHVSALVAGGKIVCDTKVSLTFDRSNFATICIYWEDGGVKKYQKHGLYGQMNTQYQVAAFVPPRGLQVAGDGYSIVLQFQPNKV